MFVDASAIVAMLNGESEADKLADTLERSDVRVTSPVAIFEAVLGVCRVRNATVEQAATKVAEFLKMGNIQCVPITEDEARTALVAFDRYGKGRSHPAQLNLGDCFAYAAASNRKLPLLFKGEDFTKTDIESAV